MAGKIHHWLFACKLAFLLVWAGVNFAFSSPLDSIGLEIKAGNCFVKHRVEENETMYAISRRYKVLAKNLLAANPGMKSGIKKGDVVLVPCQLRTTKEKKDPLIKGIVGDVISQTDKLKEEHNEAVEDNINTEVTSEKRLHKVEKGQTLYSVARMYGVSVNDIKKWNDLKENALKVGSVIIVREERLTEITSEETQLKADRKPDIVTSKSVQKNNIGYDRMVETGLAELFETEDGLSKHLALHRTAPTGTIIKLKNRDNGAVVFVKVAGKLPVNTDPRVIIKVSKMALDRVEATGDFFKAEISYMPVD